MNQKPKRAIKKVYLRWQKTAQIGKPVIKIAAMAGAVYLGQRINARAPNKR